MCVFFSVFLLILLSQASLISEYNPIIHELKCQTYSPFLGLKYGLSNIHHVKGVGFCSEFSKRTCCSPQNFEQILAKWIKMNKFVEEVSENCLLMLRRLMCFDCDSDIGVSIKAGLCPRTCNEIYRVCSDDFFKFNEINLLSLCDKNSVICSKAKDIAENSREFCKFLGFEENPNENYQEFFENNEKFTKKPLCFNLVPSSSLFGPANRVYEKKSWILMANLAIFLGFFIFFWGFSA